MKLLKIIRNSTFLFGLAPVPFLLACRSEGISPDQKEINEFAKNFDTKNAYQTKNKIYPTWSKQSLIPYEDIGINDEKLAEIIKEKDKSIELNYKVIAVNQIGGEVYIDVILKKNNAIKTQPIKITNFIKSAAFFKKRSDDLKEILKNKNLKTNRADLLPGSIGVVGKEIKISDLGIKEIFSLKEMKDYEISTNFQIIFKTFSVKDGTVTVDIKWKTLVRWEKRGSENNSKDENINIQQIVISGYRKS